MNPYYVTTAITYPNGDPHVGHAYEYIATDAIARFKRLDGFDVRFLTGTDVHGLKMAQTAAAEGIPTAELARQNELLRRQALELEQASAAKSQFLANVSHELRTPLNAILGYAAMTLQGVSGELSAPQRRNLSRIDANARHLLTLINEILDITRIEAGRMPIQVAPLILPDLLSEVVAEHRVRARLVLLEPVREAQVQPRAALLRHRLVRGAVQQDDRALGAGLGRGPLDPARLVVEAAARARC